MKQALCVLLLWWVLPVLAVQANEDSYETYTQTLVEIEQRALDIQAQLKQLTLWQARYTPDSGHVAAIQLESVTDTLFLNGTSTTDDTGHYTYILEVTASGTDLVIPRTVSTLDATTTGFVFGLKNASGTTMTAGTVAGFATSTGLVTEASLSLNTDVSEILTVTLMYDPVVQGRYQAALLFINTDHGTIPLTPVEDYQSDLLPIPQ